jgi:hypothetical protein
VAIWQLKTFFAICALMHVPFIGMQGERQMTVQERTNYLLFLINCFQSLEDEMVQRPVLKLVSLPLWHALSPGRRQVSH